MASFGLSKKGKKGGKADERTAKEKKDALAQFYERSYKSAATGMYGNDTYLNAWEVDINKLHLLVEGDENHVTGRINIGTAEKPVFAGENYVYPPGYGNLGENMAGVGTKYKDNPDTPKEYKKSFVLVLGLPLPAEFVANCTRNGIDVNDRVAKTREFLRLRKEKFIQFVVDTPKAYDSFRLNCYESAKRKTKDADDNDPRFVEEFKYLISEGLKMQTADETFTVDGKPQTITTVKMKVATYSNKMPTPEHVEKELQVLAKSAVADVKEVVAHIENARSLGYGFCDPVWTDENGKREYVSILNRKFNVGDIIVMRCRHSAYAKGINRGVSVYIVEGRTMFRNGAVSNSTMVTDEYKKQDPRKPAEILVLRTIKTNTTAAADCKGVSTADLATLLVKPKKMTQEVLVDVLAKLSVIGLVACDGTHVKLLRFALDIDTIPVDETPAEPSADIAKGNDTGKMNMMDASKDAPDVPVPDAKKQKMDG